MKKPLIVTGLLCLALWAAMPGCSLYSRLFQKDLLEGDPDITGIAVASCDIIANFQDRGFFGTVLGIDDNGSASGGAITGVDGIELEGIAKDNVVVFPNLQPGTYKLELMRGARLLGETAVKKIYDCPSDWDIEHNLESDCPDGVEIEFQLPVHLQEELTFDVKSGEVVFIGNLILDERHDPPYRNIRDNTSGTHRVDFHQCKPDDKFRIERDPQAEINTLERISSSYGDNYWTDAIKGRLTVLKQEVGD
jgi:hypothetical protein